MLKCRSQNTFYKAVESLSVAERLKDAIDRRKPAAEPQRFNLPTAA
jgi:hypothetical protein